MQSCAERERGTGLLRGKDKESTTKKDTGARSYTFRELAFAAQNFRDVNLIGEGGFGSVYKGRLESGQVNCAFMKFLSFLYEENALKLFEVQVSFVGYLKIRIHF